MTNEAVAELEFVRRLMLFFQVGLIKNLKPNVTLRAYIAVAINCTLMRISKKWTNDIALGEVRKLRSFESRSRITNIVFVLLIFCNDAT